MGWSVPGVLVQEEERARGLVASLEAELAATGRLRLRRRRALAASLTRARADFKTWNARLREVSVACTPDADLRQLLDLYRRGGRV